MLIISPKASDMMKYELEKAVVKGRVGANSKPVMRLAILEGKFHMGIDTEDFIQETDDIIMLNGIKVVMTKETSLLLDESTLDFYETDEVRGFGLDQIGKIPEEDNSDPYEGHYCANCDQHNDECPCEGECEGECNCDENGEDDNESIE